MDEPQGRAGHEPQGRAGPIRSVGVCLKPGRPESAGTVRGLEKWLRERGLAVLLDEDAAEWVGARGVSREEVTARADLVTVLGGDGTLLSVARAAGPRFVPILGVNLGTLGFLTEIAIDELFAALERVLGGDLLVERRMRLDVRVERGGETVGSFLALNDAVVAQTALSRMIDIDTRADGTWVTTYHADGLIVSTPTGSTAYSLSAGGPIVAASFEALVLTPISPHTLTQRPLVLPPSVELLLAADARGGEVRLTLDGQEGVALREGDRVRVRRSEHPVALVVSPFRNAFEILRTKLHWGER
jgi:NAD+ kinase